MTNVEQSASVLPSSRILRSSPLNSSPILLAQAGRAAPQCLDAAPAPVHLVEQTILLSGQREVLLPAPMRLALRSPLRLLLLLVAHMASHITQHYARAQYVCLQQNLFTQPRRRGILRTSRRRSSRKFTSQHYAYPRSYAAGILM